MYSSSSQPSFFKELGTIDESVLRDWSEVGRSIDPPKKQKRIPVFKIKIPPTYQQQHPPQAQP